MEAIVLAGGLGTRLRGVVPDLPKPMAPIRGRPFLEIFLSMLARRGATRFLLSVGHQAEVIIDHFGMQWKGVDIEYVHEDLPLGTGGAIAACLDRCQGEPALIANGDTYLELDIDALASFWRAVQGPVMVTRYVDDTRRYGRLSVNGARICSFVEKGEGGPGLINAGAYVLSRDHFASLHLHPPFSFEVDYLPKDIEERPYFNFEYEGSFIDIGVPDEYARAQTLAYE